MHDATRPTDPSAAPSAWDVASQATTAWPPAAGPAAPETPTGGASFGGRTPSRLPAVRAGIILGCALVVAVGTAVVMGASPSSPDPSAQGGAQPSTPPSAAPNQPGNGNGNHGNGKGNGGPSFGGRPFGPFGALLPFPFGSGPAAGPFGGGPGAGNRLGGLGFGKITVTAIAGDQLSLATDDGWTRTITVTSDTKITKGGQAATIGDIHVGDEIRFAEKQNADDSWTITDIAIVEPQVAGTVTAVGDDTITIAGRNGTSQTIHTNGSTTYHRGNASATRSDVTVGSMILAAGDRASDGTFTASTVTIAPARVAGTVSAVTGDTVTISRPDGTTLIVHVSSTTAISVAGVQHATISDVKPGMVVGVEGSQRSDGSLDAAALRAGQPGQFRGGHGPGPKNGAAPAPSGSPSGTSG